MIEQLLTRNSHRRKRPTALPFLGDLTLAMGRCHEFCGTARHTLAMMLAGTMEGPVFWISPGWLGERLNPEGMIPFVNPGRFTFMAPTHVEDLQWTMEEVLRSGAVPLVVAEMPAPPALTPVRRLHLAAETGVKTGRYRPMGIILSYGQGGAQGVESRWQMNADHDADGIGWSLTRLRARTEPVKSWRVTSHKAGFELTARQDNT
jgi:protein ImuA